MISARVIAVLLLAGALAVGITDSNGPVAHLYDADPARSGFEVVVTNTTPADLVVYGLEYRDDVGRILAVDVPACAVPRTEIVTCPAPGVGGARPLLTRLRYR